MGQLMRASGTYNLQKTMSRSCLVLAVCLSGGTSALGRD